MVAKPTAMKNLFLYFLLVASVLWFPVQSKSSVPALADAGANCLEPAYFSYSFVPGTSNIQLSWSDNNAATWEVILQNNTSVPALDQVGEIVHVRSYIASNLVLGNSYYFFVRSVCPDNSKSNWVLGASIPVFYAVSTNDEPEQAIALAVNTGVLCNNVNSCVLAGGSPSAYTAPSCGTVGNDLWYKFIATNAGHAVSTANVSNLISLAIYASDNGTLTYLDCTNNSTSGLNYSGFVPGNTYYVRVWRNDASGAITTFNLCVKSVADCSSSELFCGSSPTDPYIFENVTSVPSSGQVACLGSNPNPRYITLKVTESGPLQYQILQNTSFDAYGNPTGTNLDVDFVLWGPFDSAHDCSQIVMADCPTCPNNNSNPNFYPLGNIVDCSYSASYVENLTIAQAQAGQYYKLLITNFNGQTGYIKLVQTNYDQLGSGRTACADKLQLIAFVDLNNNGVKDANEPNFPYGTFAYQVNDAPEVVHLNSPSGRYDLLDANPANSYDLTYEVYPEFANHYACSTSYSNLSVAADQGVEMIYFPVTALGGPFYDPKVSLSSVNPPVPGTTHQIKVTYQNEGNSTVSGTLTFTKDPLLQIGSVNQPGVTMTASGFSYDFADLMPFQTKSFTVFMSVPTIPAINISDLINNSIQLTTAAADVNLNNNTQTLTEEVVAAYDPNDKTEIHGGQILISNFDNSDYLQYTIRFQNTGTANAINVRIVDILSELLDEQSIRMVSATHNYTLQRINNQLVWNFNNIQLKPKIQDEALSQGQLVFMIKPRTGFGPGTTISNQASIFFDTNPPIITEEAKTTFVNALANLAFTGESWSILPNPADHLVEIELGQSPELLKNIEVADLLGKTVLRANGFKTKRQTLDVSGLSKGMYLLTITTQNELKQVKKLLVK